MDEHYGWPTVHNRSEVAPWQRKIAFLEDGKKFLYNHSRELIHISHFPIDYYLSLSPNSMLKLAEYFMRKQKGLKPDQLNNPLGDLKSFIEWYEQSDNPQSFFEEGINLSKMSEAYLKQNTTNSHHSDFSAQKEQDSFHITRRIHVLAIVNALMKYSLK